MIEGRGGRVEVVASRRYRSLRLVRIMMKGLRDMLESHATVVSSLRTCRVRRNARLVIPTVLDT